MVKGWLAGSAGVDRSRPTPLPRSPTPDNRHPFGPPASIVEQWLIALDQSDMPPLGVCSHTRPVSLSRTASLLNSGRSVNLPLVNLLDQVGKPDAPAARPAAGRSATSAPATIRLK